VENIDGLPGRPIQREFARLNINWTVMSKRKLLRLVKEGVVNGWDDPRMPTLSGMRRRGYTPAAIRSFCKNLGLTKFKALTDMSILENAVREDLNRIAARRMAVLHPLKLTIENYPEGQVEELEVVNNPEDAAAGSRKVPLSRDIYIDRDDFAEEPVKGWHRFTKGAEVRLTNAFCVACHEVIKDDTGKVVELRCTYDDTTRHGGQPAGRPKVKGVVHWVSAPHSLQATVRLYDRLFSVDNPDTAGGDEGDFASFVSPQSLEILEDVRLEGGLAEAKGGEHFQFVRVGYFFVDPKDSQPGKPVFNRTVSLKDSFTKQAK